MALQRRSFDTVPALSGERLFSLSDYPAENLFGW